MFDNTKPNVVLISDFTDVLSMAKTLGPYKIAHVLRQHGIEVMVIHHASVFSLSEILHVLENVISDKTLYVGVNNMFYVNTGEFVIRDDDGIEFSSIEPGSILPHGKRYNDTIKEKIIQCNPNCKLVLGGPTARDGEHVRIFDYIITGYAEYSALNLAQHLLDHGVILEKSRKSIWGPVIISDNRAEKYEFSNSTMGYHGHDVILPGETLVLEVARGCIFKCAFCSYPMNGKKKLDFVRSSQLLRQELIDNYEKYGVSRYIFSDDTVNDSPEKCEMIYRVSKSLPFKLEWWGYIRLDLLSAHPETIEWIFDSGCRSAFFGIETLHPETAKIIGKGGNREKLFSTVKHIKDKYKDRVNLHGSFVFGLPKEPVSSMEKTSAFLLSDDCVLDSWLVQPLNIRSKNQSYDNEFISDLDVNYEKYGYIDISDEYQQDISYSNLRHELGQMIWKNEYTDRIEMENMVQDLYRKKRELGSQSVTGMAAFSLSSLGIELDTLLNKKNSQVNWHSIDQLKWQRATLYKKTLFEKCGVPSFKQHIEQPSTFSAWIKNKYHVN
jgi:radical SAM superfamily enzyme YgiQ (UPF0313 family)